MRNAKIEDAGRLAEIYDYYVKNTAVSFEYEAPTTAEFERRMRKITEKYPYVVAKKDGVIAGYAYATALNEREAYGHCCEVSIYVERGARKCGIGKLLYEELEKRLKKQGNLNLYACVAYPEKNDDEYLTKNSARFHLHMGFEKVGEFHRCGYKFGRWYNVVWMEKCLRVEKADGGAL